MTGRDSPVADSVALGSKLHWLMSCVAQQSLHAVDVVMGRSRLRRLGNKPCEALRRAELAEGPLPVRDSCTIAHRLPVAVSRSHRRVGRLGSGHKTLLQAQVRFISSGLRSWSLVSAIAFALVSVVIGFVLLIYLGA
jgi:hypothetical protein